MKPNVTEFAGLTDSDPLDNIATVEEVANHLGIFGDTSENDTIIRYLEMAVQHVEAITKAVVIERQVTERYSMFDMYLDLSQNNPGSITVKYSDSDLVEQSFTDFILDSTPKNPRLVILPADLMSVQVYPYHKYPVRVEYTQTPRTDYMSHAREVVMHLITQLFYSRGEANLQLDDGWVYRLLEPYRNKIGTLKNAATGNDYVSAIVY